MTGAAVAVAPEGTRPRPGARSAGGQALSRRRLELALLVPAVAVGAGAHALAGYGLADALPSGYVWHVAIFAAIALAAHLAVRFLAPAADPVMLPVTVALNGLGLAMIARLDVSYAARAGTDGGAEAPNQLLWTALGVATLAAVLALVRDPRVLQRYPYTFMVGGLVLLMLPLVPGLGVSVLGAQIWVRVGPFSFQPAEVAKILLVIFFAGYLVTKRDALAVVRSRFLGVELPRARDLGPILLAWLISLAILVFQRDLGTSLLFFGLFVAMLYMATGRRGWIVIGVVLFLLGGLLAYQLFGHVQTRIQIWLHPFEDPTGAGYQLVQSLYGMAAGGILGTGLGQGNPDLVPFARSDFIVSAIGEELGLTGLMAVLVLYAILVERGFRTALASRDVFGRLLAGGLAFVVGFQVFVIVGGVTGLIPLTGLTTPFLSAGGSSLIANWALVALLLRQSDAAERPVGAQP